MTSSWKNYHSPGSVEEAVSLLQHYDGRARVIGGGTDLLVEMRRGVHRPVEAMVDASRIDGLDKITRDDEVEKMTEGALLMVHLMSGEATYLVSPFADANGQEIICATSQD